VPEPSQDPFPPKGVDLGRPSIARVYDYYLGGTANWAIDRELGDRAMEIMPQAPAIARANRRFLFRAVRHLMRLGVRQFVDLGAGLPTMDHTHAVADSFEFGTAKVVYVDNEPVAVAHSQILLEEKGDPKRHTAINADIRAPERLWRQVMDTGLIDVSQPVALLLIAVLHFQQLDENGDEIGAEIVARYRDLLSGGSYLAVSHVTDDGVPDDLADKLAEAKQLYAWSANPMIWRTHKQVDALFGDFELLEPGLTWTYAWHPDDADPTPDESRESVICAAVGRKP
jgi:O-methyltransferase involved in polyketide biosynthesis